MKLWGSLRNRIVIMGVGGTLAIMAAVLVTADFLRLEEAQQGLSRTAGIVAELLSGELEPALPDGREALVARTVQQAVAHGDILAVVVFDRGRRVLAAAPVAASGNPALGSWPLDEGAEPGIVVAGVPSRAYFRVVRGREGVRGGCWVVLDRRPLLHALRRFRLAALLLAACVVGACMVLAAMAAESVVRPLDELAGTVGLLDRGELRTRHPIRGPEEMRRLGRRINRMAEQLEASRESLGHLAAELDHQVRERTAELAEFNRHLTELAHSDPLTGLANRRGLEIELERYLALCSRTSHPLAVIMMDLDNFKTYNDRCGHLSGDTVLRAVGTALRQRARSSDMVSRWGGDEFCILVPATDAAGALAAAQRYVLAVLEAMQDLSRQDVSAVLGASAGVACFPEDGTTGVELVARADEALYRVKASGGSRVLRLPPTPPELDEATPAPSRS